MSDLSDNPFPVLDFERRDTVSIMHIGLVDAYLEERDGWATMPVRVADHCISGPCIELGVFTLDESDIEVVRAAISVYDRVVKMRNEAMTRELPE